MSKVNVDLEREQLQQRVTSWIINDLKYDFLGNLEDQENMGIKEVIRKSKLI